jgi:precorrin-6B methylase 1
MTKPQKHPKEMTTDEAIRHLFHPKVVKGMKRHVKELDAKSDRKPKKGATT